MVGCHHPSPLAFDPLDYLHAGVEPGTEADAVAQGLRRAGFVVTERIAGASYVALGARRASDGATAVRVITAHGTALGVDAPDRSYPTRERVLLVDLGRDRDFDGDGHSEVAIRVVDPVAFDTSCIAIVRVGDDDSVQEVGVPTLAYGERACVDEVGDFVGDARIEALIPIRFPSLAFGERLPEVHLAFEGVAGTWGELDPALAELFQRAELGARAERLAIARAEGDVPELLALGVEQAALESLLGSPTSRQHEVLDLAVAGLRLPEGAAAVVRRAHAAIEVGLVPHPVPVTAPAPASTVAPTDEAGAGASQGSRDSGASAPAP